MDCPRCSGVEMNETYLEDETPLRLCPDCSSVWIDSGDMTRILVHNDQPGIDSLGGRENLDEALGNCPEDLTDLMVVESTHGEDLSFAMCEVCGGMWLLQRVDGKPFQGETEAEIVEEILDFFRHFARPRRAHV